MLKIDYVKINRCYVKPKILSYNRIYNCNLLLYKKNTYICNCRVSDVSIFSIINDKNKGAIDKHLYCMAIAI